MDWSSYHQRLEAWVSDQYRSIAESQKNAQKMVADYDRIFQANFLASKKYEAEMQKFQLRASQNLEGLQRQSTGEGERHTPIQSHRYIIPHPWRRVAAEVIDTALMLLVKLLLIYLIRSESSIIELSKYFGSNILSTAPEYRTLRRAHLWAKSDTRKKEFLFSKLEQLLFMGENDALDEADLYDLDILFLVDHVGRFICALLEAIFISHSFLGGGPGGATLGKWVMNLRVVACEDVIPLPDMVEVIPGTDLGFSRALVRSMLKGTSFLTIFSFICMLLFRYHRCTYDIIAGTLVVQPIHTRPDPPQQMEQNGG
ncbi:unnamed protein product [Calicophoron daubneyi]|uniref:RDD domain-containing protein n=1 Tax=Calicophoron daubneyi TaxID=300641 RepID=A0AAV2TMN5_CALDB